MEHHINVLKCKIWGFIWPCSTNFIFLYHYLCPNFKTDMIRIASMCGLWPGSDRHDIHMWSWSRENKTREGSADVGVFIQTSMKCICISWFRNIRTTAEGRSQVSRISSWKCSAAAGVRTWKCHLQTYLQEQAQEMLPRLNNGRLGTQFCMSSSFGVNSISLIWKNCKH